MTATLLAHGEHIASHNGAEGLAGAALLLIAAATVLWWTHRRDR
jgi:hypothetical protein